MTPPLDQPYTPRRAGPWAFLLLSFGVVAGCNAILGVDRDYVVGSTGTETGTGVGTGGSTSTGGGGTAGTGGTGGGTGGCETLDDCPIPDNPCQARACFGGECGTVPVEFGQTAPPQEDGDCQLAICDGNGNAISQDDDSDWPDDDNDCTEDLCNSGTPENLPLDLGTPCNQGNGSCDGAGICVECVVPSDCPGEDDECRTRTCTSGTCGVDYAASGTLLALQTSGDCHVEVCDGSGGTVSQVDDTDLPVDDNDCTQDVCTSGTPTNPPEASGTTCGTSGQCDGAGSCIGCTVAGDCPGADDFCKTRTCVSNTCGFTYTASGTPLPAGDQTDNDCQELECNGSGGIVTVADDSDVPLDDGSQCTGEECSSGVPVHPALPLNTGCTDGGTVCDGAGTCVECNAPSHCDPGTACQTATCTSHVCGITNTASGTPAPASAQTPGDCKLVVCDGSGGTSTQTDSGDLPVDGNPCTGDVCTGSTPSNPNLPAGTVCETTGVCDGSGTCSVLKPNGDPCTSGDGCQSGFCVDGFCCDGACGGLCAACSEAKTGGADGVCTDIPLGADPDDECSATQVCDGSGACTLCGNGTCDTGETESSCPADCGGVIDVGAGDQHSCAVLSNGGARCWGNNGSGQLGNGTTSAVPTVVPVVVSGITTATQIGLGDAHTCARLSNGTARCWGNNGSGQLGNGTVVNSEVPVAVTGLSTVVEVYAGRKHSCARLSNGTARCWGRGNHGQLGNGGIDDALTPVAVSNLTGLIDLDVGVEHACAAKDDGTVWCWGDNGYGKLGDGTVDDSPTPVQVLGVTGAETVFTGDNHSCAMLNGGEARCWGRNADGQLGDGTGANSLAPVVVSGMTSGDLMGNGFMDHTCAVLLGGTAQCWGRGKDGQLGDGVMAESQVPTTVLTLTAVTDIAAGGSHSCAVSAGHAWCWGANTNGELGDGSIDPAPSPVQVSGL